MKKIMLAVGAGIIALGAAAGIILWAHQGARPSSGGNPSSSSSAKTVQSYRVVGACQALTLADATAVLGQGTRAGSGNGRSDAANGDVVVSTCSYSGAPGLTAQETKTVTLLARSAKTPAGAASNKSIFGAAKPAGKQNVPGIGDAAFWDQPLSQLDVLQGNNWYIIGNMS